MKIIKMTGNMPPCCCGDSGGGGGGNDCCACDLLPDSMPLEIVLREGFGAGCGWIDETIQITKGTNSPVNFSDDNSYTWWEGKNACGDSIWFGCSTDSYISTDPITGIKEWVVWIVWCSGENANTVVIYCDPSTGSIYTQDQSPYTLFGGGINCCCDEVGWFEANINTTCDDGGGNDHCGCENLPDTLRVYDASDDSLILTIDFTPSLPHVAGNPPGWQAEYDGGVVEFYCIELPGGQQWALDDQEGGVAYDDPGNCTGVIARFNGTVLGATGEVYVKDS
jgi:hypothetical protein